MSRIIATGLTIVAALATPGCQKPATPPEPPKEPISQAPDDGWTESQREAFDAALAVARDKIYRQLRRVRIARDTKIEDLVRGKKVSIGELRNLAASARISRVRWLSDGGCHVELVLGLLRVVEAADRWDQRNTYAPHDQILDLADAPLLEASGESHRR